MKKLRHMHDRAGKLRRVSTNPRIDIRPLISKYQDNQIVQDVHVDRLSLCKEGSLTVYTGPNKERRIQDEYEEIASIKLPQ